jgi:hypothetical protein
LVVTACLYFYHAKRSAAVGESGGPHFLCVFGFVLTVCSVGLALSRGGILFATLLSVVFVLGMLSQYLIGALSLRRSLAISLVLAALLAVGGTMAYRTIDWAAMQERFGDIGATLENVDTDQRTLSSRATWEMAQDRLWFGWGAGSFRYAFPKYQQAYPELWHGYYHRKKGWLGRKFFRYAHNDLLQFLAEYGIVGCSLLLAALLSLLGAGLRGLTRDPWVVLFLLFGVTCAAAHAFADFIFSCPCLLGGLGRHAGAPHPLCQPRSTARSAAREVMAVELHARPGIVVCAVCSKKIEQTDRMRSLGSSPHCMRRSCQIQNPLSRGHSVRATSGGSVRTARVLLSVRCA